MDVNDKTITPSQRWAEELKMAEEELKKFHERAVRVTRKFLDERDTIESAHKWFNIFYANTQILESALYSQLPKPSVTRRFKDYDDDVSRVAATILQRSITQDLDDPRDTFDSTMRQCVQDRLVPGLGQAWLRLETDTEEIDSTTISPEPEMETEEIGETESEAEPLHRITDQRVVIDYIFWKDFLWSPCRVWEERRWVARRVYMTKEEMVERFGEDKILGVSFESQSPNVLANKGQSTPIHETLKKAAVFEIWERASRKVFWFTKNAETLLDEKDDPLQLVGFEPCPRPMFANLSTSNTAPRPDYYMIQDQYTELDTVNNRISLLVSACKVVGVYDKSAIGIQRMLNEGFDNQLIPVDNWAMFAEKNGLKGQVDWLPLEVVVQALGQLNLAREAIKGQIYELTGIADIVRGASKASETLGAQQIKAQFASVRIKKLQDEVARFASDIMRIKAELQVKHFTPELMIKRSNIMQTIDAPFVPQAIQLLQSDDGFEWRVQVTADSIAQADYAMEKTDRLEFLTAVSGYLERAGAMFQAVPGSAPLLVGMLKWAVAGFRNASEIEGMIDKELDAITKSPPQEKPDPEQQKMEMEQQQAQQQAQMDQQKAQMEMQMEQQKNAMEMQRAQMEMKMEQQRLTMELAAERQRLDLEAQRQAMDMRFEQLMNQSKLMAQKDQGDLKLEQQKAATAAKPKEKASV